MELTEEMIEQLKANLKTAKTSQDLMGENGAIKKIIKASIEGMLDAELTEHLGYEKYSPSGKNTGNSRNGRTHKTLKNDNGEIELTVPRDRNGSFDPIIVKKYERTLGPIEDKIISMYAKGMTTRDIQSLVQEFYGLDKSATLVSQITDKIIDLAKQWHNRPLESVYPIVFFDAIHYKVTSEGKVTKQRSIFPNDDAQKKMLFLVYRDISKKWTVMPVQNWAVALSHLSIIFDERLKNVL